MLRKAIAAAAIAVVTAVLVACSTSPTPTPVPTPTPTATPTPTPTPTPVPWYMNIFDEETLENVKSTACRLPTALAKRAVNEAAERIGVAEFTEREIQELYEWLCGDAADN